MITEWINDRKQINGDDHRVHYVGSKVELDAVQPDNVDYLLGLFADTDLDYIDDNPPPNQPRLEEMTEKAINVLQTNDKGYFLFVEGARIDHGHHDGIARYALNEAIELDKAIAKAVSMVDLSETLIVVTADHSHTLTISGYLDQGEDILGIANSLAQDNKTYTVLNYANGPGGTTSRLNESEQTATSYRYLQKTLG